MTFSIQDKGLIALFKKDIKDYYDLNGKGAVKLIEAIFMFNMCQDQVCWASKNRLAKEVGVSKRQIYNLLNSLQIKGIIRRERIKIWITTSFLRFFARLKSLWQGCLLWQEQTKIKLVWLWKRYKQSIHILFAKCFNQKTSPPIDEKLHPSLRSPFGDINKSTSSSREVRTDFIKKAMVFWKEKHREKFNESYPYWQPGIDHRLIAIIGQRLDYDFIKFQEITTEAVECHKIKDIKGLWAVTKNRGFGW